MGFLDRFFGRDDGYKGDNENSMNFYKKFVKVVCKTDENGKYVCTRTESGNDHDEDNTGPFLDDESPEKFFKSFEENLKGLSEFSRFGLNFFFKELEDLENEIGGFGFRESPYTENDMFRFRENPYPDGHSYGTFNQEKSYGDDTNIYDI